MFPEGLRSQLTRSAREPLPVVESRRDVEQPVRSGPVRVELGVHVGTDLEQDLIRIVRGRDAFPGAGAQGGQSLCARGRVSDRQKNRRAARDARIGAKRPAQLDTLHVGQLSVYENHIGLGGAGAVERMLAGPLLEDGVSTALEQAPEPARRLLAVAREQDERQAPLWHSLRHQHSLQATACV